MSDSSDKKRDGRSRSVIETAFKTGAKAFTTASTALRSEPVRKIRGGIRTVAGGLAGVSRFIRTNSLRGLLAGEIVLSESELNRWFARVDTPDNIAKMELRCRPSRLVLVMSFERKLFGLPLGTTAVDLPFEISVVDISSEGGLIELRLDQDAIPEAKGLVRPIVKRLLSRAAADLLEEKSPLERLDLAGDVIERSGNRLLVDVGAYPPFVELMNRELRLLGGTSLFPFRAIAVKGARVEEGRLVVQIRLDPEQIASRRIAEELDALDEGDEPVGVLIVDPQAATPGVAEDGHEEEVAERDEEDVPP